MSDISRDINTKLEIDKFVEENNRNLLRNNMYLPLTMDEAVYLRGAVKSAIRNMKSGDERDFNIRVLDRLNDMIFQLKSYQTLPF